LEVKEKKDKDGDLSKHEVAYCHPIGIDCEHEESTEHVGHLSGLLMLYLSTLQVHDRGLDIGKRTSDKVSKEKTYGSRAKVQGSLAVLCEQHQPWGLPIRAISIFKPDDPGSVHPLVASDIVRWWSEDKAIGWHRPKEGGKSNQTCSK
jgi:hypothetical protein